MKYIVVAQRHGTEVRVGIIEASKEAADNLVHRLNTEGVSFWRADIGYEPGTFRLLKGITPASLV